MNGTKNRALYLTVALGAVGLVALLLMLGAGPQPAAQAAGATIKVPDHYATIQAAIDAAADGDTILVAAGYYTENLRITQPITLSGGWNISFTLQSPGASTIDGSGLGRVISITCATSDTVVTVDGFTVQNGNATGLGGAPASASAVKELPLRWAGSDSPESLDLAARMARLRTSLADVVDKGLYPGGAAAYQAMLDRVEEQIDDLENSEAQPHSTKSASQQAADCGGGIYGWNTSLHLLNSTIRYNIASLDGDGRGGGVCVGQAPPSGVLIAGSTFRENTGSAIMGATGEGGGLYTVEAPGVVIEDNNFNLNAASDAGFLSNGIGGGLMVWHSPDAVVRGNQVVRNTANAGTVALNGLGGGAYLGYSDGATVEDNVLRENLAMVHG
ncbi:right-handed parallel beta-helix repeat-containing protein, partial [Chloroflexota bacterium]